MAIRFARQAGNWSDPLTWDDSLTIPTTGDEVYFNGFNITIDQNVTTGLISNGTTVIGVPGSIIPDMTSNTTPTGVGQAFASGTSINAYIPFRKGISTWGSGSWGCRIFCWTIGDFNMTLLKVFKDILGINLIQTQHLEFGLLKQAMMV